MASAGSKAVKALSAGLDAEGHVMKVSASASERLVTRTSVDAASSAGLARRVDDVVALLSGGHTGAKDVFAEAEACFEMALLRPTAAKVHQAGLQMGVLADRWTVARADLRVVLTARTSAADADRVIRQLDDLFDARYGFVTWTSRIRYDLGADEVRRIVREEIEASGSPTGATEVADWAASLPFLAPVPATPARPAGRGLALREDFRELEKAVGARHVPDAATLTRQAAALDELARFHGAHDVLFDDVVDIVDTAYRGQLAARGPAGLVDPRFVQIVVGNVQGRMAETLALKHPRFLADVWKPAVRTSDDLAARLNTTLGADVPLAERWRTEVIHEPSFATTTKTGAGGQLLDSGIWLVRESPGGNVAMPIFGLEVKSGEARDSIIQQLLDRARAQGGVVTLRLPGSDRTFLLTLPPAVEFRTALASTRRISDKLVLGEAATKGPALAAHEKSLAGQEIFQFRVPMPRSQIRDAASAYVAARLHRLRTGRVGP